jgi:hypothetical protein
MLMGIESARESNQLFESPLDPLAEKSLALLSFPPHSLLHYTSTKGESVPPEHHLQAIRAFAENHSCYSNKEQLFAPLSVVLGDGREMIGLLIHRGHGSLSPVFLDRENELIPRSHLCIGVANHSNQDQPFHRFSTSSRLKTENTTLDIFECENQQLVGLEALDENRLSQENVKEHATLSARASVDHGVEVKTTEEHVNRAADRGCCVSTCSLSYVNYRQAVSKPSNGLSFFIG